MSNDENTDNFTALYASNLRFSFGINLMHSSSRAHRIFVFFSASLYKFMLFKFRFRDTVATIDHVQIA